MYEKEMKPTIACESEVRAVAVSEVQIQKRALAEDCLVKSEKILDYLVGPRPLETNEKESIDCFMADLLSERETIQKLNNNLSSILDCLGA